MGAYLPVVEEGVGGLVALRVATREHIYNRVKNIGSVLFRGRMQGRRLHEAVNCKAVVLV